jgi:hypothetical protein
VKADKSTKILFAPHEIGGQMQLMVEELRHRGKFATAASYGQEWFGHVNDVMLGINQLEHGWQKQMRAALFTLWAANTYDIFHFFWGESLFGTRHFSHLDLALLKRLGKKIFVHFRGLDIVDLGYFDYLRARTAGDNVEEPPMSRPEQLASLKKWRRYADAMFVSEPDLLWVVPEATMIQQAIDLSYWKANNQEAVYRPDNTIRIAHAPSMRRKKGTEFVEQSINELKNLGYQVELVLIEKMPFHQVKSMYESCDIGIDQVLYGWYGKVSIELMALGKPVITYINDDLFSYRSDMPIVNANPHNLSEKLKELIDNHQLRRELGERGIEYVQRYHDVKAIIDQCLEFYGELK